MCSSEASKSTTTSRLRPSAARRERGGETIREDLLEILCCPTCKADLRLNADQRDASGEILTGTLTCVSCHHAYPIEDGIPNLLPPELEGE